MKRFLKRAYSVTMAFTLFASTVPMTASANSIFTNGTKNSTPLLKEVIDQKKNSTEETAEYREGEAIVMYYATSSATKNQLKNIFGSSITVDKTWDFTENESTQAKANSKVVANQSLLVSKVSSDKLSTEQIIDDLQKKNNVKYAEPNYIVHATDLSGTYGEYQWCLDNKGQNGGTKGFDINADSIWDKTTGTEKVIAIVDTGVDYTHTDLADNIWKNPYSKVLKGEHGYDFANGDADPIDDNGHGSHCAGIIAGSGKGVSGVNQSAKIMALKFLTAEGSGDLSGAVSAYDYINKAIKLGVDVVSINNSWGGGEGSKIFEYLVNLVGEKGAITVAAAGNSSSDNDEVGNEPFNFQSDYLITVAASNEDDELASFSSYGKKTVDLAAPGADILSSVSYDCYNPTIHANDPNYSELYADFNKSVDLSEIKTFSTASNGKFEVKKGTGVSFGPEGKDGNSLCLSIDADQYGFYGCYVPLNLPKSSTDYYVSAMIKGIRNQSYEASPSYCIGFGGISKASIFDKISEEDIYNLNMLGAIGVEGGTNYWSSMTADSGIKSSENGEYGLWFILWVDELGQFDVYIDNVGFSKKDMQPSEFGKYDFYNGTSMATPQVTGAVALLSEAFPSLSRTDLRELTVNSVRKSEACKDTTVSGGVLDLSKAENVAPVVKSVQTKKDTITLQGLFFGDEAGKVTVNGAPVAVTNWKEREIVIPSEGYLNKYIDVKVTRPDGQSNEKTFYASYNETEIKELGEFDQVYGGQTATDGSSLYYINNQGAFYKYSDSEWKQLSSLSAEIIDPDVKDSVSDALGVYPQISSQLVYADGNFYGIVSYDTGYYASKLLVKYNIVEDQWTKVSDLPYELMALDQSTLAAYEGKLYILGGLDSEEGKPVGTVFTYDYNCDVAKFVKSEQTIPERFAAVAAVANNKLIVTLGGDGTKNCPSNLEFDGKNWTEVKGATLSTNSSNYYYTENGEELPYYTAQIGLYEDGLIYTDMISNEYGDVFTYSAADSKFNSLPCSLYDYMKEADCFVGTTVGEQFLLLSADITSLFDMDTWEYYNSSEAKLYSFDIKTGFFKVTGNDEAQIEGLGYYYPGAKATIKLNPLEGNYVSSFKVNGAEVEGSVYSIDAIDQNYNVEVTWGKYVQSIQFDSDTISVKANKKVQLQATVAPADADNKEVTWSVDNTAYATVDQNGLVKTKKAGAGKSVTVTASSKDGSEVTGSIVINITKK